jgi:hypothetical protein
VFCEGCVWVRGAALVGVGVFLDVFSMYSCNCRGCEYSNVGITACTLFSSVEEMWYI